jgi:spore coat polysaccharide biosynthesis protein SpsF (cytidylyltransferase family)
MSNTGSLPVTIVVQARLGSTRLPNKAKLLLQGHPMIHWVLYRAGRMATFLTDPHVILAVPLSDVTHFRLLGPQASVQMGSLRALPFSLYGGDPEDVLCRITNAVQAARPALSDRAPIIRLTGDCPLVDPMLGEDVIEVYERKHADYVGTTTMPEQWPDGMDVEAMAWGALKHLNAALPLDHPGREHVTSPFYSQEGWVRAGLPNAPIHSTAWPKLSVDTWEDARRVDTILGHLLQGSHPLPWTAWGSIRTSLSAHPV